MRRVAPRTVASGVVTVFLLSLFVALFDPQAMWRILRSTDLLIFGLGLLSVLLALVCWNEALRILFAATPEPIGRRTLFVALCTGTFGRQVLPMGNAGGPVLTVYAISRNTDRRSDETFAVVTVDAFLGLLGMVVLATLGVCYLLLFEPSIQVAYVLVAGLLTVVGSLGIAAGLVTYRRMLVERFVQGSTQFLADLVGERSPRLGERLTLDRVSTALRRYYATIDTVSRDRRAIVRSFVLTAVGRICFSLPLYTGALALGVDLPIWLTVFVAIVSGVVAIVPLPGGVGGVEFAGVGLLVLLTGLDPAVAAAVVLLYRACSYWFLILVTGLVSAFGTAGLGDLPTDIDHELR